MHMIFYQIIFFILFINAGIYCEFSYPKHKLFLDSDSEIKDQLVFSDSSRYITEIELGIFPKIDEKSVVSPGFGIVLFYEKEYLIDRFSAGWYFSYKQCFTQTELIRENIKYLTIKWSFSIGRSLIIYNLFKNDDNNLKIKFGLGFTMIYPYVYSVVGVSGKHGIYYSFNAGENVRIGTSISIENIGTIFLPPQISFIINF